MATVHPSAVVEPGAELAEDVTIGPFCHIGPHVKLAAGVRLHAHVVVTGHTELAEGNEVFPFAALGTPPQDLSYKGQPVRLIIGANNVIREHVTMHPGTVKGGEVTRVGSGSLFMIGVHIAHDCQIGDHVIMANNATLGGHVAIQDYVYVGGLTAMHQYVRIGRYAMIGGMTGVENDVIPYGSVMGNRARLVGLNLIGMKRRGFAKEEIRAVRAAYRMLFAEEGAFAERVADVAETYAEQPRVMEVVRFIREAINRPICHPPQRASFS